MCSLGECLQLVAFSACNLLPNVLSSYCCASIICAKQCTVNSYENTTASDDYLKNKFTEMFSHCSQYHTMWQCDSSLCVKEIKSSTYWRFLLKFLCTISVGKALSFYSFVSGHQGALSVCCLQTSVGRAVVCFLAGFLQSFSPVLSAGKAPHVPLQCKYKYTYNHHPPYHLG